MHTRCVSRHKSEEILMHSKRKIWNKTESNFWSQILEARVWTQNEKQTNISKFAHRIINRNSSKLSLLQLMYMGLWTWLGWRRGMIEDWGRRNISQAGVEWTLSFVMQRGVLARSNAIPAQEQGLASLHMRPTHGSSLRLGGGGYCSCSGTDRVHLPWTRRLRQFPVLSHWGPWPGWAQDFINANQGEEQNGETVRHVKL